MKFFPNTADNRFPTTPGRMRDMIKMVAKQQRILDKDSFILTNTLVGLHYCVPEIGFSLCQILMAMRSYTDPKKQLFMAVDERRGNIPSLIFTVHIERYAEANSIIPVLWVILNAEFGPKAWDWFTDLALQTSQGYAYDVHTGHLTNIAEVEAEAAEDDDPSDSSSIDSEDNQLVRDLEEHLCLTDAPSSFHVDIRFVFDSTDEATNQYGDSGTVNTMRSACAKELYDQEDSNRKRSPDEISIDGADTQSTSTLTDYTKPGDALIKLLQNNPDLLQSNPDLATFLRNQSHIPPAPSGESKPPAKKQTEPPTAAHHHLDSAEDQ